MLFKKVFLYEKIKGQFSAQKSNILTLLLEMYVASQLLKSILKGVLAIISSKSFSNYKVE